MPIITNRRGERMLNENNKPVRYYRFSPGNFPTFLQNQTPDEDGDGVIWERWDAKKMVRCDLKSTSAWHKTPWSDLTKRQRQAVVDHYNRIYEGELAKEAEKVAAKRERKTTNKREERKKEAEVEDDRKPAAKLKPAPIVEATVQADDNGGNVPEFALLLAEASKQNAQANKQNSDTMRELREGLKDVKIVAVRADKKSDEAILKSDEAISTAEVAIEKTEELEEKVDELKNGKESLLESAVKAKRALKDSLKYANNVMGEKLFAVSDSDSSRASASASPSSSSIATGATGTPTSVEGDAVDTGAPKKGKKFTFDGGKDKALSTLAEEATLPSTVIIKEGESAAAEDTTEPDKDDTIVPPSGSGWLWGWRRN